MQSARRPTTAYNFFHPAYWFGDVDARPLGLFRIGFGALMLKEALYHIFLASTFYSDSSIVPRAALDQTVFSGRFSLMSGLAESWMAIAFFILWALVALGLLLGWQTRVMSLLNFVLLLSMINRDPFLVTGAEIAMIALAFWSLFLPLGRCYSLDARRSPQPPTAYAFPVRMIQIQVALVYIFTAIFKLEGQSWPNGYAIYMALQVRLYTFPLGDWFLANAPFGLLQILTFLTLVIEAGIVPLVFAPILQPYLRAIGLLLGVALHIGIGLLMAIPNFPLVMLTSYLLFFDSRWVNALEQWIQKATDERMQFSKMRAECADKTVERKGCGGLLAGMARGTMQGGYRAALAAFLLFCMTVIIWGNLLNDDVLANNLNLNPMPPDWNTALLSLELSQTWSLFAPEPLQHDGWFILAGTFTDGRVVDVQTDAPPGVIRPQWFIGPFSRWSKFEENLMGAGSYSPIFASWGAYTCRTTEGLKSLQIILRSRLTSPPGQAFQPYTDQIRWQDAC